MALKPIAEVWTIFLARIVWSAAVTALIIIMISKFAIELEDQKYKQRDKT